MDIITLLYLVALELFRLLPLLAYFLIYKKFNTIWMGIAFYSLLFASILYLVKSYGMQGFSSELDGSGVVVGVQEASRVFYYTSYIESFLTVVSLLSFVTFALLNTNPSLDGMLL